MLKLCILKALRLNKTCKQKKKKKKKKTIRKTMGMRVDRKFIRHHASLGVLNNYNYFICTSHTSTALI